MQHSPNQQTLYSSSPPSRSAKNYTDIISTINQDIEIEKDSLIRQHKAKNMHQLLDLDAQTQELTKQHRNNTQYAHDVFNSNQFYINLEAEGIYKKMQKVESQLRLFANQEEHTNQFPSHDTLLPTQLLASTCDDYDHVDQAQGYHESSSSEYCLAQKLMPNSDLPPHSHSPPSPTPHLDFTMSMHHSLRQFQRQNEQLKLKFGAEKLQEGPLASKEEQISSINNTPRLSLPHQTPASYSLDRTFSPSFPLQRQSSQYQSSSPTTSPTLPAPHQVPQMLFSPADRSQHHSTNASTDNTPNPSPNTDPSLLRAVLSQDPSYIATTMASRANNSSSQHVGVVSNIGRNTGIGKVLNWKQMELEELLEALSSQYHFLTTKQALLVHNLTKELDRADGVYIDKLDQVVEKYHELIGDVGKNDDARGHNNTATKSRKKNITINPSSFPSSTIRLPSQNPELSPFYNIFSASLNSLFNEDLFTIRNDIAQNVNSSLFGDIPLSHPLITKLFGPSLNLRSVPVGNEISTLYPPVNTGWNRETWRNIESPMDVFLMSSVDGDFIQLDEAILSEHSASFPSSSSPKSQRHSSRTHSTSTPFPLSPSSFPLASCPDFLDRDSSSSFLSASSPPPFNSHSSLKNQQNPSYDSPPSPTPYSSNVSSIAPRSKLGLVHRRIDQAYVHFGDHGRQNFNLLPNLAPIKRWITSGKVTRSKLGGIHRRVDQAHRYFGGDAPTAGNPTPRSVG